MEYIYKNTKIYYQTIGNGDELVVFLHGWGAGSELFIPFANNIMEEKYTFLFIDFPPFGQSNEPKNVWNIHDYYNLTVEIIENFYRLKKYNSINIISHSFGGRVAILLASNKKIPVDKLVLIASAGLKPKRRLKYLINISKYKVLKVLSPQKASKMGSDDYKRLSTTMKATFSNIVNADLANNCKNIECQTLIIFGDKDKETPIYMAKRLKKLIINSQLLIVKGEGHFVYLQQSKLIEKYIILFLNS